MHPLENTSGKINLYEIYPQEGTVTYFSTVIFPRVFLPRGYRYISGLFSKGYLLRRINI